MRHAYTAGQAPLAAPQSSARRDPASWAIGCWRATAFAWHDELRRPYFFTRTVPTVGGAFDDARPVPARRVRAASAGDDAGRFPLDGGRTKRPGGCAATLPLAHPAGCRSHA